MTPITGGVVSRDFRARGMTCVVLMVLLLISASSISTAASASPGTNHDRSNSSLARSEQIDSCTDVISPGRYVLTDNLTAVNRSDPNGTVACIEIKSDDVILDGKGHTIDGKALQRFDDIKSNTSEDHLFNSYGIKIADSRNVTVRNVTTTHFVQGVGVFNSVHVLIEHLHDTRSIEYGIYLGYHAHNNTLRYNTLENAEDKGIAIYEYSDNVDVYGNSILNNSHKGIALDEVRGTRIYNNTIKGNGGGITIDYGNYTRIVNNTISYSDRGWPGGINARNSHDIAIVRNQVRGPSTGIWLRNVTSSHVKTNTLDNRKQFRFVRFTNDLRFNANRIAKRSENVLLIARNDQTQQLSEITAGNISMSTNVRDVKVEFSDQNLDPPRNTKILMAVRIFPESSNAQFNISLHSRGELYGYDGDWNGFQNERRINLSNGELPLTIAVLTQTRTPTATSTPFTSPARTSATTPSKTANSPVEGGTATETTLTAPTPGFTWIVGLIGFITGMAALWLNRFGEER